MLSYLQVQRAKLCRSELPANDAMRRFNAPRPFLLLPRVLVSGHCDSIVTNFTAAEFRALYCKYMSSSMAREETLADWLSACGVDGEGADKVPAVWDTARGRRHVSIELYGANFY
ncbi:hypothetical protein EVAR_62100_1 [Eumeta japonica]|uniref:Uncharacterized protein n=1 Tax=Eumeta variegata TaxID=151549 RepID=A0A4C1Z0K5_EUMVA|nr:hypothetical protein EVAR_62100_1 [Eumeta japonica]